MESPKRGRSSETNGVTSPRKNAGGNGDHSPTSWQRALLDRLVAILRRRPHRHQAIHDYLEEEHGNTR